MEIAELLTDAFAEVGAHVVTHHNCRGALAAIDEWVWTGAVLDYNLGDATADPLCEWLSQRGTPFVILTGYDDIGEVARKGMLVRKPANINRLVELMAQLVCAHRCVPSR